MAEFGVPQYNAQPMKWYENTAQAGQQQPAGGMMQQGGMMSSFPPPAMPYGAGYGQGGAGSYGSFDDEPPLLEELGIDLTAIYRRTRCMLTGRLTHDVLKDLDLGGPLLMAAGLGFLHLLMGKLHFGVILGWTIVASLAISWVSSMIAGPSVKAVDVYSCSCLLGYCMIPMLVYSAIALFIRRGLALAVIGLVSSAWCARLAASVFGILAQDMKEHFWLLFYPCMLYYGSIALISVY